jgi:hypothetical protein
MVYFSFFSEDPYSTVVQYLEHMNLGKLSDVVMYTRSDTYHYVVYYEYFTCLRLIESMKDRSETKLVYGENEYGYPVYWKIWWD